MALTLGSRFGVYKVTALIGEAGMGQVYRATDTTLGRQVAIKILPDAFAADAERSARFHIKVRTDGTVKVLDFGFGRPGVAAQRARRHLAWLLLILRLRDAPRRDVRPCDA